MILLKTPLNMWTIQFWFQEPSLQGEACVLPCPRWQQGAGAGVLVGLQPQFHPLESGWWQRVHRPHNSGRRNTGRTLGTFLFLPTMGTEGTSCCGMRCIPAIRIFES